MRSLATLAAAALAPAAIAQTYTLQDLGTLWGQSEAFAIDVGPGALGSSTQSDAHFRPCLFGGAPTQAPDLAGFREHYLFGVDGWGRVYGTSYTLGGMGLAAFRVQGAVAQGLGNFSARAVTQSGVVVGTVPTTAGGLTLPRACVYEGGVLTTLPTLGGASAVALAVDEGGWVAGSSTTANEAAVRPCVWVSGAAIDLGTLGGSGGQAAAIRALSVVGTSQNAAGLRRATRWTLSGAGAVLTRTDLGGLGGASSFAMGLNASGDAVGTSGFHAVLYTGGQVVDLNSMVGAVPGWTLEKAWAIADDGVIVGTGSLHGFPRAFRLQPLAGYCPADFDHNGFVNGSDFDVFVTYFEAGDARADVNADGFMNGTDFDDFVTAFEAGC